MILVLVGKDIVLEGWPSKIEVIGAPSIPNFSWSQETQTAWPSPNFPPGIETPYRSRPQVAADVAAVGWWSWCSPGNSAVGQLPEDVLLVGEQNGQDDQLGCFSPLFIVDKAIYVYIEAPRKLGMGTKSPWQEMGCFFLGGKRPVEKNPAVMGPGNSFWRSIFLEVK